MNNIEKIAAGLGTGWFTRAKELLSGSRKEMLFNKAGGDTGIAKGLKDYSDAVAAAKNDQQLLSQAWDTFKNTDTYAHEVEKGKVLATRVGVGAGAALGGYALIKKSEYKSNKDYMFEKIAISVETAMNIAKKYSKPADHAFADRYIKIIENNRGKQAADTIDRAVTMADAGKQSQAADIARTLYFNGTNAERDLLNNEFGGNFLRHLNNNVAPSKRLREVISNGSGNGPAADIFRLRHTNNAIRDAGGYATYNGSIVGPENIGSKLKRMGNKVKKDSGLTRNEDALVDKNL